MAAAMVAATGCKREVPGCMDADAINHNAGATLDDGSCRYAADEWAGSYEAHDTVAITSQAGQVQTTITASVMLVERIGTNRVRIDAMLGSILTGRVTLGLFTPDDDPTLELAPLQCSRVGTDIRYTYFLGSAGGSEEIRGMAVRQ